MDDKNCEYYDKCDKAYEKYCCDDYDSDDEFTEYYSFTNYNDLLCIAEQEDNPNIDKITNIINALIKTNAILYCKEVGFKIDNDFGDYDKWVEKVKIFNDKYCGDDYCGDDYCGDDYYIVIDEDEIISIFTPSDT